MDLYEHLAPVYDEIFPCRGETIDFLLALEHRVSAIPKALDLGSATGSLARALVAQGWEVTALEPSEALHSLALRSRRPSGPNPRYIKGDMRELSAAGIAGPLDIVLCLGNTLPHLQSREEVRDVLATLRSILRPGGLLVLQLVNFGILGAPYRFPRIDFKDGVFSRNYEKGEGESIVFETELTLGGERFHDRTALLPIDPDQLEMNLRQTGYDRIERFAAWDGSPFDPSTSPYLILTASPGLAESANSAA